VKFIREDIIGLLFAIIVILIVGAGIFLDIQDGSELTHYAKIGILLDKWHETVCTSTYDGTSYYDDCDEKYTLVIKFPDTQLEQKVSNRNFLSFKIGEEIEYQYDRGKLGGIHNQTFLPLVAS
jgi:hypothetical protein